MGVFRKKPVEINAIQFDGSAGSATEIIEWVLGSGWWSARYHSEDRTMKIDTLEGTMTASAGDWIIQGVSGEHYPCKPDIFQATYDRVEV